MRLFAAGQGQAALARLDAARRSNPSDPAPATVLGFCLSRMGRREEARRALDQALTARPDFAPAWHHRGVLQQDGGDVAAAARDFERAVALDPTYVEPLAELADHAARRGDAGSARAFAARVA
ncbi:MAG TPA: tetratricopeptide repeat protein, partial [Caulobacteraceae bacterium]|nr:tetratricopeptide repeat protein [Caulobacteraceae bacterium]